MKINLKSAIATKRAIFASKRKQEPPLSKPFKLHINFPDNIKEGLAGENLVGKSGSKFVTRIAEAIYFKKSYPTTEEYVYVAELITDKWPFLRKQLGRSATTYLMIVHVSYHVLSLGLFHGNSLRKNGILM